MIQFVKIELIKLWKKRDKYDDFDWVVRAVIRRKVIDFVSYYMKRNSNIIFVNEIEKPNKNNSIVDNDQISQFYVDKSLEKNKISNENNKIMDFINDIVYKINNTNKRDFSDWDRDFFDMILELYNLGYDLSSCKDDMVECMGYTLDEVSKFNSKLLALRNKLNKKLNLNLNILET